MKKKIIFTICFILVFIVGLLVGNLFIPSNKKIEKEEEKVTNIDIKYNNNNKYYIITGDYNGEYDYQEILLSEYYGDYNEGSDKVKLFNTTNILNYYQYYEFCEKWNLNQKYKDDSKNYMVVAYASYGSPIVEARLANVIEEDGKITLYIQENIRGITADMAGYFLVIPVDEKTYQNEIKIAYTGEEYENILKYNSTQDPNSVTAEKPIIYIYPEEEMKVNIKLINSSLLITSYPKYNDGWNIMASPNGNLKDLDSNRNYYGLYYEGKNHNVTMKNNGFIVKGEETTQFLEEKLSILGLNEREINEFIIYWLPRLENNKYNYIRFETSEEIESYMPLEITPTPDSIIRVIMDYKPLDKKLI